MAWLRARETRANVALGLVEIQLSPTLMEENSDKLQQHCGLSVVVFCRLDELSLPAAHLGVGLRVPVGKPLDLVRGVVRHRDYWGGADQTFMPNQC